MKFERLTDQLSSVSDYRSNERDKKIFWKQTLLLATAIFLMIAPAPDSHDIAEITANFIIAADHSHPSSFKTDQIRSRP